MKKTKKPKIPRAVIGTVLVFLVLLSVFMAGHDLWRQKQAQQTFEDLADMIAEPEETVIPQEAPNQTDDPGDEIEPDAQEGSGKNLALLFEQNQDCIGWLAIPGTVLDYPLMYTPEDPEKYLRKDFYGAYSANGVPFLDSRCSLESANLIIYGHNMNNGTMFGSLKNYTDASYYAEHPTIELETAAGKALYTIFSVTKVQKDDAWYRFLTADTETDFLHQIRYARECSLYDTGIIPAYGQQLLTLSTCYGSSGGDGRLLIIAAKTE